jgi:hypothetical protein
VGVGVGAGVLIPFPNFFRPNPSSNCEIERKSQSRWFIFVMTFKKHFSTFNCSILETILLWTRFHVYQPVIFYNYTKQAKLICVQVDH